MVSVDELAAVEILAGLPPQALAQLAAGARKRTFAAGELVFAEGDAPDALHIVQSGSLHVAHPNDPSLVLEVVTPGHSCGELGVLNHAIRTASATAAEPSATIELRAEDVERVLEADQRAIRALAGGLARALTFAKEEIRRHNATLGNASANAPKSCATPSSTSCGDSPWQPSSATTTPASTSSA
jgi:CRP/FNR family transcriptional regulator, cyclic AMP receptor protein